MQNYPTVTSSKAFNCGFSKCVYKPTILKQPSDTIEYQIGTFQSFSNFEVVEEPACDETLQNYSILQTM
jgi:hypothetical protein